jgi:hypothetical protein
MRNWWLRGTTSRCCGRKQSRERHKTMAAEVERILGLIDQAKLCMRLSPVALARRFALPKCEGGGSHAITDELELIWIKLNIARQA